MYIINLFTKTVIYYNYKVNINILFNAYTSDYLGNYAIFLKPPLVGHTADEKNIKLHSSVQVKF